MPDMIGIILAAGKGTRMKSSLPKALHPICGKPMTRWVIDACKESGVTECVVVIGHGAGEVREGLGADVRYAVQEQQLGTGHACKEALIEIEATEGNVIVATGDTPLLSAEILKRLAEGHVSSEADATVLTAVLEDAGHYGRIIRASDGSVQAIIEAKDCTPEQKTVREMNSGIYCFKLPLLRKYLAEITPANAQGEYYLTDVISLMVKSGHRVAALVSDDEDIVLGINHRVDLAHLTGIIRRRILEKLMLDGVTLIDPCSTYADADVVVGRDTVIYPMSVLEKGCRIGEGCVIGPSTRMVNVEIGDGVAVLMSNLVDSAVGDGTRIGPFANVRPGCRIGAKVVMGDFVEAKNSEIGDGVSMAHLSYVGDASVGEGANIGAGTITCNYDGKAKHRTVIGRGAFIGSNSTLIAPVEIGDGAYVGAGSTITEDVPPDSLAIARERQSVKEGWAKRRREGSK